MQRWGILRGQVDLAVPVASAELALANMMLARKRPSDASLAQFDKVLELAPANSGTAMTARNNRAIILSEIHDEEAAFDEWSSIADDPSTGIADEIRACALNNRADILAGRGMHDVAISDRGRVLQLRETSYNRRFIALFRRSGSYVMLGRLNDAIDDLSAILKTPDISEPQKVTARIERASLLIGSGETNNASRDLEMALASDDLPRGAEPEALVGLADAASLERDNVRAEEYLDLALRHPEIARSTTMRAGLVMAQICRNRNEADVAHEICRKLLARVSPTSWLYERIRAQLAQESTLPNV